MTDNHPITPPPELVQQWVAESWHVQPRELRVAASDIHIAAQAARWGADQELEACWSWLYNNDFRELAKELNNHRRPKPPSLKEQALAVLDDVRAIDATHYNILRNALEQLND
jgi:hypothetical protein